MNVHDYKLTVSLAFASRIAYEQAKIANTPDAKDNILTTLRSLERDTSHERIAEIMLASNVDANYINRQERTNARFNVKSADKVVNVARVIAKVAVLNHYTVAVLRSIVAVESAKRTLTHADCVAAMSASGVTAKDAATDKLLVRYANNVSPSTASTQASSSCNALQMYGVISETRDESNRQAYKLNRENANTRALLAHLEIECDDDKQLALL